MGQHLARLALLTTTLGGCSWLYDPDRLSPAVDALVPPPDISRPDLRLTDVGPPVIYEGQGDGGSRAAIVVVRGSNIAQDARIEIVPAMGQMMFTVGTPVIASDFGSLAVPLTIPATKLLTGDVLLDITITQPLDDGTTVSQSLKEKLTLRGLPELDKDSIQAPGNIANTVQLLPLYSKIDLSQNPSISWVGTKRVELRATSSITVANLQANGGNASMNTPGAGGPGGCSGGGPSAKGLCAGGGGPGASAPVLGSAGGGGGAGFASAGNPGGGNGAGAPGTSAGSPTIATYDGFETFTANMASGGGGGGNIGLTGMGAGGGGGGGIIEITAGGNVKTGTLTVLGGKGGEVNLQGSGGGGAGGVVMLRSGGTLEVMMANVSGGGGGTTAPAGGAGSAGRVRWDVPLQSAAPPPATPVTPHRGPAYAKDTPLIFNEATPSITVYGTVNDSFDINITDQDSALHSNDNATFAGTAVTIKPKLQRGYNLLCISLSGGKRGTAEADKCIEVAFVP